MLSEDAVVPAYAHDDDAGADLYAEEDVELAPFARAVVPTGVAIALPAGHAGFIHPRSGLSSKHGVTVVNAPGTIDAGYRGEIKVPLINLDPDTTYTVSRETASPSWWSRRSRMRASSSSTHSTTRSGVSAGSVRREVFPLPSDRSTCEPLAHRPP